MTRMVSHILSLTIALGADFSTDEQFRVSISVKGSWRLDGSRQLTPCDRMRRSSSRLRVSVLVLLTVARVAAYESTPADLVFSWTTIIIASVCPSVNLL